MKQRRTKTVIYMRGASYKYCRNCGKLKKATIRNYHRSIHTKDGFQSNCIDCTREYMRQWHKEQRARAERLSPKIITMYYDQNLEEEQISEKLKLPKSMVQAMLSKERTRRKRQRNKEAKNGQS